MQRLMPDSGSRDAERRLQPLFRKINIFSYLALALSILAVHGWIRALPNRLARPDAVAPVRFVPAGFAPQGFAPLHLAGAWEVHVADPRFGGVSALAADRGRLLALTDSGTVVRLPMPGRAGRALVRDLPFGPASAGFKRNRDSEALARDPAGRGWWVAFEHWHQLWLYDHAFRRVKGRVDFGKGRWPVNRGIEAMVLGGGGTALLFPESGREWLRIEEGRVRSFALAGGFGSVAAAAPASDGRLLLVARKLGLAGFDNRLLLAAQDKDGMLALRSLARLGLGATDNVEAIAVEPRAGGTRLWLMTDNDFRPRAPTYLVALDWP
jgi:hypothetical protein